MLSRELSRPHAQSDKPKPGDPSHQTKRLRVAAPTRFVEDVTDLILPH